MESIIEYSLRRIKEDIPSNILSDTFLECTPFSFNGLGQSVDSFIKTAVLENSVFKDVSLISGKELPIDISTLPLNRINSKYSVLQIPLSLTGGRRIIEAYRVEYHHGGFNTAGGDRGYGASNGSNNLLLDTMDNLTNSLSYIPTTGTSNIELIAPNTISITDNVISNYNTLFCKLEIDNQLSHVPTKAFDAFGDLAVSKCKQLIFTRMNQAIGEGKTIRGVELSVYTDQIHQYSDSGQTYRDFLKIWRNIEANFDVQKKRKHIRLRMPH